MGSLGHVLEKEDVDSFLDKLILKLDVNTPNKVGVEQSTKNMKWIRNTNWFKRKNNDFLTAEEQGKVLMKARD